MTTRSSADFRGGWRMQTGLRLFDLFLIASAAAILFWKFSS